MDNIFILVIVVVAIVILSIGGGVALAITFYQANRLVVAADSATESDTMSKAGGHVSGRGQTLRIGLQKYPRLLEVVYLCSRRLLRVFRRWMVPGGVTEKVFVLFERIMKRGIFDCRMCGDCVLHSTGMTCPMTCPKNMRNGPCGGVSVSGNCEIIPEMRCVWMQAWERSRSMNVYGDDMLGIIPPVNRQLQDGSAWINDFSDVAGKTPPGWMK